ERGSPLLVAGDDLTSGVRAELGDDYRVVLGMRYGQPSIETALRELNETPLERIVVLPLFPQYASATTGSAMEHVMSVLSKKKVIPTLHLLSDFFAHPGFIDAQAQAMKRALVDSSPDKVLISFHGLPERHLNSCCAATSCDREAACPPIGPDNRSCYRAQCYATARALAEAMQWDEEDYVVSFQSRMGRERWIHPYTDTTFGTLVEQGVRHLAVVCPAFVADCLETTEEIGLRGTEQFKSVGGDRLQLLPCVNADPAWVRSVAQMVRETVGDQSAS
ncbi:MAG: ferrochelatase, partial [Kiritimatiellia bacterium]